MSEYRILTGSLTDPDNFPCHCYCMPTEAVYLAPSLDLIGWECSACHHRWPTQWARYRARNEAQKRDEHGYTKWPGRGGE